MMYMIICVAHYVLRLLSSPPLLCNISSSLYIYSPYNRVSVRKARWKETNWWASDLFKIRLYLVLLRPEPSPPMRWLANSYHRTSRAIAVFYSDLGGLSGRCLLKNASHFRSVIWSLRERTARHRSLALVRPLPHSQTTGLLGQQGQSRHCT